MPVWQGCSFSKLLERGNLCTGNFLLIWGLGYLLLYSLTLCKRLVKELWTEAGSSVLCNVVQHLFPVVERILHYCGCFDLSNDLKLKYRASLREQNVSDCYAVMISCLLHADFLFPLLLTQIILPIRQEAHHCHNCELYCTTALPCSIMHFAVHCTPVVPLRMLQMQWSSRE